LHVIGELSGTPSGFRGLPDRGSNKDIYDNGHPHFNLSWGYDIMFHNGVLPAEHSLYGLPPMCTHDLIFFNWIKSDEIKILHDGDNFNGIKLADWAYPLTAVQKANNFYRVIKVMIHENYSDDLDEYFLVEYHKGSEFDKNFTNLDDFSSTNNYNKGVLIWHIKERTNLVSIASDNLYDLEVAVPYNGWYGNPIPNDSYPRDYTRDPYWNNFAGEPDYLDDLQTEYNPTYQADGFNMYVFSHLQDGGRHIWETTDPRTTYPWYKPAPQWFYRPMSMRSDFFTDQYIKGRKNDKLTDVTRPSSKDWAGNYTHISIKNIKRVSDYMTVDVAYNDDQTIISPIPQNITKSLTPIPSSPACYYPTITWDPVNLPDIDHYEIYKAGLAPNNFSLLSATAHTAFTDTTEETCLFQGYNQTISIYYYVASVFNPSGISDPSDTVRFSVNLDEGSKKTTVSIENTVSKNYELMQNYPNPFNPTTTITYQLPSEGLVRLYVFDSLGNTVLRLVNKRQAAGKYSIEFDATNIPSGVYYYRIESGYFSDTKKMILLK